MPGRRIAIVEDDNAISLLLRYNLEMAGYAVESFENGAVALDHVLDDPPDLLLLDWVLPDRSGLELLREVRRRAHTRALPVVMVTARSDRSDSERALDHGVDAYFTKPFSVAAVLKTIESLLRPATQPAR
ncbi:MAG: response regulator transcription factor [Hyphomicrobiaceae bacterium]|jgi:two-component system phosphate regulon response regulator PhoB